MGNPPPTMSPTSDSQTNTRLLRRGREGQEPITGYKLSRFLGQGGVGEVWEVEAPGGIAKAMKIVKVAGLDSDLAQRERAGLEKVRSLRHPYLLTLDRIDEVDGQLIVVMELADGNLADRLRACQAEGKPGIPREEVLRYLSEAAEVLDLLSKQYDLQHLDVKPNNLLLSSKHVQVADFGLVRHRDEAGELGFSAGYAAPEIYDGQVAPTSDQYSLAVTYQELLTGVRPYSADSIVAIALQQREQPPNVSPLPEYDRSIIAKALNRDPSQRYGSCSELMKALRRARTGALAPGMDPAKSQPIARMAGAAGGRPQSVPIHRLLPVQKEKTADAPWVKPTTGDSKVVAAVELEAPATPPPATYKNDGVHYDEVGPVSGREEVHTHFLAALPNEVFAWKLRGLLDALSPEVIEVTFRKTLLRFRPRGLFMSLSTQGIFLQINTRPRGGHAEYRQVDVHIWSTVRNVTGEKLQQRANILLRAVRAFLMAMDRAPEAAIDGKALLKELWQSDS